MWKKKVIGKCDYGKWRNFSTENSNPNNPGTDISKLLTILEGLAKSDYLTSIGIRPGFDLTIFLNQLWKVMFNLQTKT